MADKKEATHSLRTEIQMLFNTQGADQVVEDVKEISQKVANLVEPVKGLTNAFAELNASPLRGLVKILKNFSVDSVAVDASNLRKVIENKIATAITKSKIEFIGDEGSERYPFKVKMGKEFWEKNHKNVAEAMAKSFANFEVDTSKIPPLDNRQILEEFQKRFNEQIVELIKDQDIFSLFKVDPKTKVKKFKYKRKFTLDENTVEEIMKAIESEFVRVLSDPANINLGDIPKLNLKSDELKQVVLRIQESIGNIDSLLGVDAKTLGDLPNIEDKLVKFRDNLTKMIKEINTLAEQLDSITIGKATEEDVKKAIKSINNLKDSVTIKISKWIEDVTLALDSQLNLRPDLSSFKESIKSLNNYLDTLFQQQIELFQQDIDKVLNKLTTKDVEQRIDLVKGKKLDITQLILDVITENILKQEIPIAVDSQPISETIRAWTTDFGIDINEQLNGVLESLVNGMSGIYELLDVQISSLIQSTIKDLNSVAAENAELFNTDELRRLIRKIQEDIYSNVVTVLSNVTVKSITNENFEFDLPKSFRKDIKRVIDNNIKEYMRRVSEYSQVEGLEGIEVNDAIEKLRKHTTMIVNAVMRQVNQCLTNIRREFAHEDIGLAESTENLKNTFKNNIRALTKTYIKALENSINTIILTEESLEYLKDEITNLIKNNIKVSSIGVDAQEVSLTLDGIYSSVLNQVSTEINNALSYWTPHININDALNGEQISRKLTQQIDEVLQYRINDWVNKISYDTNLTESSKEDIGNVDNAIRIGTLDITKLLDTVAKGIEDILERQLNDLINEVKGSDIGEVKIDVANVVKRIDTLLEKLVLNRVAKLTLEQANQEDLGINLDKPTKKVLKRIENIVNSTIDAITEKEIDSGELNIKTNRLQNNINSMIQKIINKKAKEITAYGNQLVGEVSIDSEYLVVLKESIDNILENIMLGYAEAAKKLSTQVSSSDEINAIYTKMVNGFTESFSLAIDSFLEGLNVVNKGQVNIPVSKLHPKIKEAMAKYFGVGVKEFTEAFPEISGKEIQKVVIQKNVELIINTLNSVINASTKKVIKSYTDSIKEVEIEPSSSLIEYIQGKLRELQDSILTAAKRMVKEQFKFLTEEIRQMNLEARSLGYRPTKAFTKEVSKATGESVETGNVIKGILGNANLNINTASISGADIIANELEVASTSVSIPNISELKTNATSVIVDGKVVDLNVDRFPMEKLSPSIENLLTSRIQFDPEALSELSNVLSNLTPEHFLRSNIYGRGYEAFDVNKLFFRQVTDTRKGLLSGVASNMAKYLIAGYLMRLPMKAITEANKIAAELDYHIAKARQNIVIKDPQMTATAQQIVYNRYRQEGRSVDTEEFRNDVKREATNLRNMMSSEMSKYLLNISKAYYQDIADVGRYYSIVSRRARNPYEALTRTKEIAKIAAVEEDLDIDFAATGLEALSAQWGIPAGNMNRYVNMLLKTAMLSNTTVGDLLATQRDTAAMFKTRLKGLDDEKAFATAMALSSMFVEATGKSGREAGTFWKNVLQRPYTKDSRKFLEEVSQYEGFEMLSPYYVDEMGRRVQKDFLTMFSNIIETTLKVDDPSAMSILSQIFPLRTIGGAESISALVQNLKVDLEKSIKMLKDMGELDQDTTIDTVDVKEVIEKYIENIMGVTDEDIGMYLAGLQDTFQYTYTGMHTQWQSTIYTVFQELKEEASAAMTYLTAVLRKFEENGYKLAEVIGIFMKIGLGLLGERMIDRVIQKGKEAPIGLSDVQKEAAYKYIELQALEKSLDARREAVEQTLIKYKANLDAVDKDITRLQDERHQLHVFINDLQSRAKLSKEEEIELRKAMMQRDLYDDQLVKLRNTYSLLERTVQGLNDEFEDITQSYSGAINLGTFLKNSMGARNVEELRNSFANYLRNNKLYNEIAPLAIRSSMNHSNEWYEQLFSRKTELEQALISQQREMIEYITAAFGDNAQDILRRALGDNFEETFYAIGHRLSDETVEAIKRIGEHVDFDSQYAKMRKNFENTYRELNAINSELINLNTDRLKTERLIFEATRPKIAGYGIVDGERVANLVPKTTEEILESYRSLLPSVGIKVEEFEAGMDRLAAMFKDGRFNVDAYEDALKEVAAQLGIADSDFNKFKMTIKNLNDEIRAGNRAIYDYLAALESVSTKSGRIQAGTTVKQTTTPTGLNDTSKTALGVGALSALGSTATKSGLFAKLLEKFKATGFGSGLLKIGTALGATKLGALGKGLAVGAKGLIARLPHLALIYAGVSALGSIMGGLAERGMTDSERLSLEADKLESLIKKATGWKINEGDNAITKIAKYAGNFIGTLSSGAMNQLNRLVGGTAPSLIETWRLRSEAMKHPELTRDELITQLKEMYEVDVKRYKANYQRQLEYLNKNPFVDPLTGELRADNDPYLENLPLEDLMEFLDRRISSLNKALTESDALFTKEKVKLLISGLSNNSREMREAVKKHLDRNIEEMRGLVEELKTYLPKLVPGTEAYTEMQLQIMDLENRIAESELQKFETRFSEFDEIMERYSRQSSLIQSKYDVKKYDAILSGIKSDSTAIRQIEKKMAEEQVRMINSIQSKLDSLMRQFADKPDQREKILIQIQQLEADKKRILADIKDKMSEGLSTFNLPSEIKPLTYYEAMTRSNTHRNVTVRSGDAMVNITIENMTGSDADLERLGRAVSNAVAQAQKNFVRQFANDVKAGMGNNYYSWNNY